MRQLPKRIPVMGIWHDVITDPERVVDFLEDGDLGGIDRCRDLIYIQTTGVDLRLQWQTLIHEVLGIIKKYSKAKAEHDDLERFDYGIMTFLLDLGLLDEPGRRGFYDVRPGETGSTARMAEALEGNG